MLKPGAPLVVVSGGNNDVNAEQCSNEPSLTVSDARKCLETLGFEILGEARVPPTGFTLPKSEKTKQMSKQKKTTRKDQVWLNYETTSKKNKISRGSDCLVIIALAP